MALRDVEMHGIVSLYVSLEASGKGHEGWGEGIVFDRRDIATIDRNLRFRFLVRVDVTILSHPYC